MLSRFVQAALSSRLLVIILTLLLVGLGWRAFRVLPIDAFPDITTTQVQVIVKAPGMTPEEVEQRITHPLETEIRGIPNQTVLRSTTKYALAAITIDFTDDTDVYWARQQVSERIAQVLAGLPDQVEGGLAPITTPLSEAYMFLVESDQRDNRELRGLLDWSIRPRLLSIPGVADVNALGGEVRTILVEPRPDALAGYDLTHADVARVLMENNANAGGGNVIRNGGVYLLTTDGRLHSENDVSGLTLTSRNGQPIHLHDVADVRISRLTRFGAVTADGQGEAVEGIVLTRRGANTRETVQAVKERMEAIKASLPGDVRITPFYDRSELIETATSGVTTALLQGVVLVLVVLGLFLFNVRSALTAGVILPLTVLGAFFVMERVGLTANLMSLGGIAIAIGILVDSAVVMVENIDTELKKSDAGHRIAILRRAAGEMAVPILSGVVIIIISLAPIMSLTGIEGKLFRPLALTVGISLLVSLLLSLTAIPVLASILMKGGAGRSPVVAFLMKIYQPLLGIFLKRRGIAGLAAVALLGASLWVASRTGREFLPRLEEGTIVLQFEKIPSIPLQESLEIDDRIAADLMKFPEITGVVSRVGSDELRLDPMGLNETDCFLVTKPIDEWPDPDPAALEKKIREVLAKYPGVVSGFTQPIDMRVSEMISGVTSAVAIRLSGSELAMLETLSSSIEEVVRETPGALDVARTPLSGQRYLKVVMRHDALARAGIEPAAVNDLISRAVGGEVVTEVIEGIRRIPVLMRFPESTRKDPAALGALTVRNAAGHPVPLADLAEILEEDGPSQIGREDAERMIVIESNVEGRDVVGFVNDLRQRITEAVPLPEGYRLEFGGQFENEARAGKRLALVVPAALLAIFLILYSTFGNIRQALLILLNVPFALIGGILALALAGYYLSVPASLGFVALLGTAVMNGVVLISYLNQLREQEGMDIEEAARAGAERRFRPVMMTALLTVIGLVPLLLASGPGSEIQKPLAVVVIGGTATSTALTLLLLPAIYASLEGRFAKWRRD
ncbi:efflux RND transporter permease subunit [Haloferula sp. A504]|uniref:efflux RND transporter permease subunit n=1 Tax=Haloferula sp. A504 TaxID=3373601 RepID=UPI0031C4F6EC|nr:CusA/CzcA family heavy metal efflux RND transporter [Verrucomicrobiaceae bacterium E54]